MKIKDINNLCEKAKTKKDGVYSYKGFLYGVKNNEFIAYVDFCGFVFEMFGQFNVKLGRLEGWDRKKSLLTWINTHK